jgi:hypothetical protein
VTGAPASLGTAGRGGDDKLRLKQLTNRETNEKTVFCSRKIGVSRCFTWFILWLKQSLNRKNRVLTFYHRQFCFVKQQDVGIERCILSSKHEDAKRQHGEQEPKADLLDMFLELRRPARVLMVPMVPMVRKWPWMS